MIRRAIIIGATSGIGRELARVLSMHGYELGLTGRREELLAEIQNDLPQRSWIKMMDVAETDSARRAFSELLKEMDDVELIIVNAGVGLLKPDWEQEKQLIRINVLGFVAIADAAMDYFTERGGGQLVGISSVASLKGFSRSGAYSASKAFISIYMQALRQKSFQLGLNIVITDIKPGYVATPMLNHRKGLFWISPVDKAARQIYRAIKNRKHHAYITRRWRLVAWLLKIVPDRLFIRLPT